MPRLQLRNASIVVLGQVFAPAFLNPDLFKKFLGDEAPSGIGTNVIAQLDYPQSGYVITLEENKFQVVVRDPKVQNLAKLRDIVVSFLKQNPLVRVTGAGLNFAGFLAYTAHGSRQAGQDGAIRFLQTYLDLDALNSLAGSAIGSGTIQVTYQDQGARCRLVLRSDGEVDNNEGVLLDLNVHRDISKRRDATVHIGRVRDWHTHFVALAKRLGGNV